MTTTTSELAPSELASARKAAHTHYRIGFWKGVLLLLLAAGAAVSVERWTGGLGSVTNLSDRYPWGLWKAFNVLAGVGLGAAGFTIMATVYVFNAKRFLPIVRPAVLMAFLAYTSAAVGLFFDIGKSTSIWHPIVMWNPDSILFDVAWCLMLYTTVLLLEGSGMLFERLGWLRAVRVQHAVTVPVVIVGVILSTLHQSSLGALFLIVPGKLHALWYTHMLPVLFFISAVAMGLAMVIVLARLASRELGATLEGPLLGELGRILVAVLGLYGIVRIFDLYQRGVLGQAFEWTYEAGLFQVEFLIGVVVPFVLLAIPRVRANARWLYVSGLLTVLGFVANRLNVSITGFEAAQGGHYVPRWEEVLISLMVVGLAFFAFNIGARLLRLFPRGGQPSGPPHRT